MNDMENLFRLPETLTREQAETENAVRVLDPAPPAHFGRPRSRPVVLHDGRRIAKYRREKALGVRHENGAQKLKALTARHLQIINYHVAGLSMEKIGEVMNLSMSTVWRVINDPLARTYLQNVYAARQMEVDALLGRSVDVIRQTFDSGSIKEKLSAVSAYTKLKQTVAGETNPEKTAEDIASEIVKNALNLQVNVYNTPQPKVVEGEVL